MIIYGPLADLPITLRGAYGISSELPQGTRTTLALRDASALQLPHFLRAPTDRDLK